MDISSVTKEQIFLSKMAQNEHSAAFAYLAVVDLVNHILDQRQKQRLCKEFDKADKLRELLESVGIEVKDSSLRHSCK